ncbi:MAG: hypothetical protein ACK2T2_12820 [Anaerolineales bacterium]|jgi:hypothetical protein
MGQTREEIVQRFRRMGLGSIAATLLEGFAPLAPLGAQGMLLLQPLVGGGETWESVVKALEDPVKMDELTAELRGEERHGQH